MSARLVSVLVSLLFMSGSVVAQDVPMAFGTNSQVTYISAFEFSPMNGTEVWDFFGFGYFALSGGSGVGVTAPIKLDNGARVTGITCHFNDTSAANTATVEIYKSTYNPTTFARQTVLVSPTMVSVGATGLQNVSHVLDFTMRTEEAGLDTHYYMLYFAPIGDGTLSFRGCKVYWQRQITPAPATATFNDVPVGSMLHQFVEALAAAGITVGCGNGNYCPNDAITRGQMAIFLARALGLHYPN